MSVTSVHGIPFKGIHPHYDFEWLGLVQVTTTAALGWCMQMQKPAFPSTSPALTIFLPSLCC